MDAQNFDRTNELSEKLILEMGKLQKDGRLQAVEAHVHELLSQLPDGCSISLNFSVEVFDAKRDRTLKAGTTGVTFEKGRVPYLIDLGLSPTKYLVDGVMMKVPHDQCPNCWSRWPLKSRVKSCPECGYRMGREVKLLVDTNVCPRCEEGAISLHHPHCDHCGFVAEENLVVWG
jgi:ribosomal protein L37E